MPINVPQVNPRLATITAPNLPKIDVLGAVNTGLNLRDRFAQEREAEALQTLVQEQGQAALAGNQQALDQIALQGKDGAQLASDLQGIVSSRNADAFTTAQNQLRKNGTFFASIINAPPEVQRRALFDRANELLSKGDRENGGELLQMSQSKDPLDMQGSIEQKHILSQGGDKYLQGFTNQGKGSGGLASAKTEIFRNGAAIQALPSGEIQVRDPAGIIVTGEERLQVLRDAQQSGILQAGEKATAISAGKARGELRSARQLAKEKKRGATSGEIESGLVLAANTARRSRPKIQKVRDALDAIETGKFSQAKSILGPFIPLLNIDDEEVMQAQITKFALDELNKQSGTKTDFDFQKAQEASASLGKTTAANKRILEIIIEDLDRIEEEERQFINFIDNEGGDALRFRFKDRASSTGIDSDRKIQTSVDIEQVRNLSQEELEQQILEAESNG